MSTINPVALSGDATSVAQKAKQYKQYAVNLMKAADDLRVVMDDESFISLAVDEIRGKAREAKSATLAMMDHYDDASVIFDHYATELAAAQARANRAIAVYHQVFGPSNTARTHRDELEHQTRNDGGQTPNLLDDFLKAKHRAEKLLHELAGATAEYLAAVQDKQDAVARAYAAIHKAQSTSTLHDNFFEAIAGAVQGGYEWAQEYVAPILQSIHDVFAEISKWVSAIAIILSVLSVFIPVLAPFAALAAGVALAVSAVSLLASTGLFLLGRGSLGSVIGDTIMVVASAVGLGSAVKAAGVAAKLVAETAAAGKSTLIIVNGETVPKLFEAGKDILVEKGIVDPAVEKVSESGLVEDGWDVFPSQGGADWNAPPTIQVPNVFSDVGQAQTVMEGNMATCAASNFPVTATSGGW